jgi:Domain of unknown function (DUF4352)
MSYPPNLGDQSPGADRPAWGNPRHQPPPPPVVQGGHPAPPGPAYGTPPAGYAVPAGPAAGPGYGPPQKAPQKAGPLKVVLITVGVVAAVCLTGSVIAAVAGGSAPRTTVSTDPPAQAVAEADDSAKKTVEKAPAKADEPTGFGLKPGTTVTIESGDATIQVTVKSVKTYKKGCSGFAPEPEHGMYAVVDVKMKVVQGTGSVNPLYFTWVGEDGTTSDSFDGLFSSCDKDDLDSTNGLRAGQQRAGQIVFDVATATGSVEFTPGAFEDAAASWTFS